MRNSVLKDARQRLALLDTLHNNPYQLTLWFISSLVDVALTAAWGNILIFFIFLVIEYPKIPTAASVGSTLVGVITGQAWRMRWTLKDLYNYQRTVEELRNKLLE